MRKKVLDVAKKLAIALENRDREAYANTLYWLRKNFPDVDAGKVLYVFFQFAMPGQGSSWVTIDKKKLRELEKKAR